MPKTIEKRFPASVDLTYRTFLNDKKINGELYAFFQSISKGIEQETVVLKRDMPTQAAICSIIGIKSPKTYRTHLSYLLEAGYLEEREGEKDRYYLPRLEEAYFQFPLPTIQFLLDTATDNVIKVYIYLG